MLDYFAISSLKISRITRATCNPAIHRLLHITETQGPPGQELLTRKDVPVEVQVAVAEARHSCHESGLHAWPGRAAGTQAFQTLRILTVDVFTGRGVLAVHLCFKATKAGHDRKFMSVAGLYDCLCAHLQQAETSDKQQVEELESEAEHAPNKLL